MKTIRTLASFIFPFLLLIFTAQALFGWGFWAHREIHRYAIRSLPKEMRPFFDHLADTIIARSVEPDQRRFRDPNEAFHHYLDLDRYGAFPFANLPRSYEQAVEKFGKGKVDSNGTVPWRIVEFLEKLTEAMKRGDRKGIIFYASNLGHYVADAHVPLHSTENYDGQLSDQKGIHARWESHLPEKFGKNFKLNVASVEYIADPLNYSFEVLLESYRRVDSVLTLDRQAREGIPPDQLLKTIERRNRTETQFSEKYYERYYDMLNGMIERRMNDSIKSVASLWYTAWVDAGRPDLGALVLQ
jgi:hypothetical protein